MWYNNVSLADNGVLWVLCAKKILTNWATMRRVLHLGLYSFLHMFCLVVALFLFLFLSHFCYFFWQLLLNVPDGVVGCMLGGSIPSLPIVKKSAVVFSFLLYAKPHNRNYVYLSGYSVRVTGGLPGIWKTFFIFFQPLKATAELLPYIVHDLLLIHPFGRAAQLTGTCTSLYSAQP